MKKYIKYFVFVIFVSLLCGCTKSIKNEIKDFHPGKIWEDNTGKHINAHGGGILYHDGTYYWYGEHKSDTTSSAMVGITCYSSSNLTDWKNEGVALPVVENAESHDISKGCIMERPKVVYNKKTGKFVMWFHLELKGQGYSAARSAVAISESPVGPFKYIGSKRINPGKLPFNMSSSEIMSLDSLDLSKYKKWWTPEWHEAISKGLFLKRDKEGGQMARDMQLYVDDDGKAYHIYSSEDNLTLHIAELDDEYTGHTGKFIRIFPGGHNEAPAIFKKDGIYWLITSGCTGWAPNAARMFSATNIWGPWTQHENPCKGEKADITFGSQGTFVLPVVDMENAYIFMADMWRPEHPSDARYMWLPVLFDDNGKPYLEWKDSWNLNVFKKKK